MGKTFKANQRYNKTVARPSDRMTAAEARELMRIENLVPGLIGNTHKLMPIKKG
jgi:hypothetical protein